MKGKQIGIGPTADLSLRISVASLARVVFPHPEYGTPMLALEHKATLISSGEKSQVIVKAQPFGGAIRILDPARLLAKIGRFNFDSERSYAEADFRVFIRPMDWGAVQDFCLQELNRQDGSILESDPTRELHEEFGDTLGIELKQEQISVEFVRIIVENQPAPTSNVHASGTPTLRIYRVDQVQIIDPDLCRRMITNCEKHPVPVLNRLAAADARTGGRGRANAILTMPKAQVSDAFLDLQPEKRGAPFYLGGALLEGNVAAVLDGISVPKYWFSG